MRSSLFRWAFLVIALCSLAIAPLPRAWAQSSNVSVVVDGQPMQFQQPPIEHAGRVFVPLRGVFERLGASVVYDRGIINATKGAHQISLTIGSTQATVDGQPAVVDSAPFVDNGTTLVPLRFISQALGAHVRYDDSTATVYITRNRSVNGLNPGGPMIPAPAPAGVRLLDNAPSGQSLSSHPAISAGFSRPVNPNSVRIKLDGRDVAQDAYVSSTKFVFTAPNMPPGSHTVQVTGRAQDGALFDRSWTFETGGDQAENFLGKLEPPPASNVAGRFTITGQTLPNARIKVSVSESASALSGIFRVKEDTFEETTTAGPNGRFAVNVHLQPLPGGKANVFIQSIAPSGAATIKRYSLNT